MSILLVADIHLDDAPANDYRWEVFDDICNAQPEVLVILGDICHKKDRHSGELVNRFIDNLRSLKSWIKGIYVLRGNHDDPLRGIPYWSFLSSIPDITFISVPSTGPQSDILMLPHSNNPAEEWAGIDFSYYRCVFMHQPVSGVDTGTGQKMRVNNMIQFPPHLKIYSGDAHIPQTVDNIVYVGAPHPMNYGENHPCRMLLLDHNYEIKEEIIRDPLLKHKIIVHSVDELRDIAVRSGDQAKIEFVIDANRIDQWPAEQAAIREWAEATGVTVAAVSPIVQTSPHSGAVPEHFREPLDVFTGFCEAEGLDEDMAAAGYNFLKDVL